MKYQFHPVADVFPLMNDKELADLAEDIFLYGQREPILLFENQIIDGRNRYSACEQKGITPKFKEFEGGAGQPVQLVISLNLHRRHLDASQRAMIAARLATMRSGERTDLPQICGRLSQDDAADMLNVSPRSVSAAARVEKYGCFEIVEEVDEGRLAVSAAEKMVVDDEGKPVPRTKQIRMLKRGREDRKKLTSRFIETKAAEINRETKAVCLNCNPELEFTEETLLVHLTKLADRAPARLERYLLDALEELQEEIGEGVAAQNRNAMVLIEDAIRSGYQTKDQIKKRTGLDTVTISTALAVMLEYKRILPKQQGGKTFVARGQRKEFFVMNDSAEKIELPEENFNRFEDETAELPVSEAVYVH